MKLFRKIFGKASAPLLLGLTAAGAGVQAAPRYTITDLGTLGGIESAATAINNNGQIVGGSDTSRHGKGPEFITNVFLWQNGRMSPVPGLDGNHAYVVAVNDRGQMAGAYSKDPLKAHFAAARFTLAGKATLVGGFPAKQRGYSLSQAEGINPKGQVVGVSNNQAFFWNGSTLKKLVPPPRFRASGARGINAGGIAVGQGQVMVSGEVHTHALLWDAAGKGRDLGSLPGYKDSIARAINSQGQVTGWVGATGGTPGKALTFRYQAFLWQNGKMRGLGSIPRLKDSKASALNDRGQVVGNAYYKTDEAALLWQGGKVYEFNKLIPPGSGWLLQNALSINNRGWVIGNGIHNGIRRAFLLKPRP